MSKGGGQPGGSNSASFRFERTFHLEIGSSVEMPMSRRRQEAKRVRTGTCRQGNATQPVSSEPTPTSHPFTPPSYMGSTQHPLWLANGPMVASASVPQMMNLLECCFVCWWVVGLALLVGWKDRHASGAQAQLLHNRQHRIYTAFR